MLFVVIGNLLVMGCNTRIIPYAAKTKQFRLTAERPEAAELLCFAIYNQPDLCRSKDPAIMIIIAYLREFSVTISPEYMWLPVGAVFAGAGIVVAEGDVGCFFVKGHALRFHFF